MLFLLNIFCNSRKIAKLESQLGTQLFNRNTRTVVVTEAGSLFYEQSLEWLQTFNSTKAQLKSLNHDVIGTIKIGLPRSISELYLSTMLHQFIHDYPDVHVHIQNGNHLLDLLEQELDLVLHFGDLPDSNYHFKKLGYWHKITCAAPDYLNKYGIPETPNALTDHRCLDHYHNHNRTWRYQHEDQKIWTPIRSQIRSDSSLDLKKPRHFWIRHCLFTKFYCYSGNQ
ncbi:LysR substrate-binding domain-containing protein [Piscirickettsia litoralis]|nr:LysR substrate-binding domain-containing protein [Piscirickettsia litoralis]